MSAATFAQGPRADLGARRAMENSHGDVSPSRVVRTVGELDALWERAARIVAKQVPDYVLSNSELERILF